MGIVFFRILCLKIKVCVCERGGEGRRKKEIFASVQFVIRNLCSNAGRAHWTSEVILKAEFFF